MRLKPITLKTILPCLRLRVQRNQRHLIAPMYVSLLQSIHPRAYPMGIYANDALVGFLLYGHFHYNGAARWFISRVMVDQHHQRQGYGRQAMQLAIHRLVSEHQAREIWLSYSPDNGVAIKLCDSLGFVPTGEATHGEVVVCLQTTSFAHIQEGHTL
ncbi:MAG: GNAT family N-acetyltransferase [Aggregatilineales bacterium]